MRMSIKSTTSRLSPDSIQQNALSIQDHHSYSEGAKRTLKTIRVKKKQLVFDFIYRHVHFFHLMVVSLISRRSNFIFSTSAVENVY